MLKKVLIVFCVLLAAAFVALDGVQKYDNGAKEKELVVVNSEIQQLEQEKAELEAQLAKVAAAAGLENDEETETGDTEAEDAEEYAAEAEPYEAVFCVNTVNKTDFYDEISPVVGEKTDSAILILKNGQLPGDNDILSVQQFLDLLNAGWEYAIMLDRQENESDVEWENEISAYLQRLNFRVGVLPAIYCFSVGGCSEAEAEILVKYGFQTALCHEQAETQMVGGLKVVQLLDYNDASLMESLSQVSGYCGLEMWAGWNEETREGLRYTADDLEGLFANDKIQLKSLAELKALTPVNGVEQPHEDSEGQAKGENEVQALQERIAEIDREIAELYR